MRALTWAKVNAWRLAQHSLSRRLQSDDLVQAVIRTCGIQAQVMSAAELAIGARVNGISPGHVQSALWQDRTLIKTWAMRAALHLIPAREFSLYIAARKLTDIRNWTYYFSYYGVNQAKLEDYLAVGPEILSDHPMRREEFASIISTRIKSPELYDLLVTKGWGTPLKPLAWRGDLCFGPSQGQNVTFVRPNAWIGEWQSIEPHAALQEILRRYLRAFGPATVEDFVLWWEARIADTRKLFKSLADEIELVDVEGLPAYALRDTIEPIQALEPVGTVCLLPLFDAYTMGLGRGKEIEALLPMKLQKLVYRPQGWISAIVLVDGFIRGTWEYKIQPGRVVITVSLFSSIAKKVEQGITAEAERLGEFLNTKVVLEYKDF